MRTGLDGDHQGDRLKRYVHLDVLFLAVVVEVELVGAQPVHVHAVAIENRGWNDHSLGGDHEGRDNVGWQILRHQESGAKERNKGTCSHCHSSLAVACSVCPRSSSST